eukprot:7113462-Prymnesium_polylepis.1
MVGRASQPRFARPPAYGGGGQGVRAEVAKNLRLHVHSGTMTRAEAQQVVGQEAEDRQAQQGQRQH